MEILINKKRIDFTLENEKNVSDVVKDLEKWINKNNNVISAVKVDNRIVKLDELDSYNIELKSINKIEVETKNKVDLAFETLDTVSEYLAVVEDLLDGDVFENNDSIIEGIERLKESIDLIMKILKINPHFILINDVDMNDVIKDLDNIVREYSRKFLDDFGVKKIRELIISLREGLTKVYKWGVFKNTLIDNDELKKMPFVKEILKDYIYVCGRALKRFDDASENLQIGNDITAFDEILFISSILNETIELVRLLKKVNELSSFIDNIDDIFIKITLNLKTIEEAFKNEDMITVSDTLEYELKPLFENLVNSISNINDFIVD